MKTSSKEIVGLFFLTKHHNKHPPSNLPFPANLTHPLLLISHNIQCLGCFSKSLVLYCFGIFPLIFGFLVRKRKNIVCYHANAQITAHTMKTRSIKIHFN